MDLESRTPLHSCAWQGNHEVMQLLLYYGAIPDHACKQGATALGISAQEGHEKCVTYLLKYGANPYKSDHCGRTPIKLAAKSNRNNVLRILENYTKSNTLLFLLIPCRKISNLLFFVLFRRFGRWQNGSSEFESQIAG